MIKMLEPMVGEIQQEAATTRRVLERVPADKLSWKPHPKSMTIGQLALHIAQIPASICQLAQVDEFDVSNANFDPPTPSGMEEIFTALDTGVKAAEEYFAGINEATALGNWRLKAGPKEVFAMPRVALLRSILLNHWYHHRGQMSVYLRLLDVPVPVIYGRSADENPFA
jgi:uncharacterized damage-inducible protein DinB